MSIARPTVFSFLASLANFLKRSSIFLSLLETFDTFCDKDVVSSLLYCSAIPQASLRLFNATANLPNLLSFGICVSTGSSVEAHTNLDLDAEAPTPPPSGITNSCWFIGEINEPT